MPRSALIFSLLVGARGVETTVLQPVELGLRVGATAA